MRLKAISSKLKPNKPGKVFEPPPPPAETLPAEPAPLSEAGGEEPPDVPPVVPPELTLATEVGELPLAPLANTRIAV